MYEYRTRGTCSTKIHFDVKNDRVHNISFEDGCDGNLKALSILAEGMEIQHLTAMLKGICCEDKGTSCADQLVQALESYRGKS